MANLSDQEPASSTPVIEWRYLMRLAAVFIVVCGLAVLQDAVPDRSPGVDVIAQQPAPAEEDGGCARTSGYVSHLR